MQPENNSLAVSLPSVSRGTGVKQSKRKMLGQRSGSHGGQKAQGKSGERVLSDLNSDGVWSQEQEVGARRRGRFRSLSPRLLGICCHTQNWHKVKDLAKEPWWSRRREETGVREVSRRRTEGCPCTGAGAVEGKKVVHGEQVLTTDSSQGQGSWGAS